MPLKTDFNVAPYFDDYNETKNYHRILFRPSVAVQARELTQLQTILQNQIERFGNWAFRSGDIVSECKITDIPVLPYIRLSDFSTNLSSLNTQDLVGKLAVSNATGLSARVLLANTGFTTDYPNTNIVYVSYTNTGNNGATHFANNETLTFYNIPITGDDSVDVVAVVNTYANVKTTTATSGNAHGITVAEGIIFINGNFVKVQAPTYGLVNNYGTYAGNNVVGFDLIEQIITENQDTSLLDNALGYNNENAPGAHRLKLTPYLVSYDPDAAPKNFVPIVTYNYGAMVEKAVANDVKSILGKAIEQRTFEESGNYVINPFQVHAVSSIGDAVIDPNRFFGVISQGIAYTQGKRVELSASTKADMRRGVDIDESLDNQITFNYGNYLVLNEVAGSFDFVNSANVNLYDTVQQAITNQTYSGIVTPTGNQVGTARMRCFTYNSGTPGTNTAQYFLHLFDVKLNSGYNTTNIKSVYYDNGGKDGVGDVVSSLQSSSNKSQLYSFGVNGLKNLRNLTNTIKTQYTYRTLTSSTMNNTGNVQVILTGGSNEKIPYGFPITLPDSDASDFNLIVTSNASTSSLSGTISISSTNTYIVGSGTNFTSKFYPGSIIGVGANYRTVNNIVSDTVMYCNSVWPGTLTGQTYVKKYISGQILPITSSRATGPSSSIDTSNSSSFYINTGEQPTVSLSVDVVYNVLRTIASPAKKGIQRNRFVKIDTSTNPKGPWCLGIADVCTLVKVYSSTDGSYSVNNSDVTSNFVFDSGQKDTHYDFAYLYTKPGYNVASNTKLLVQIDFFTAAFAANSSGFFSVESYPVDDSSISNTYITINTKDIPLYIDENNTKTPLRDYVDFRPFPVNTANNTASNTSYFDTSNSTQVTAAISYATVNPSASLVFNNITYIPSYGKNLQSDYTRYLPRKDLLLITPNELAPVKVKEGLSKVNPQPPLYPDNAMALAIVNIPEYPSLTTEQRDSLSRINQTSINLIRDTTPSISISLVTNRRYTMKDIGKLDNRISNLEYYQQLSLLEKKAVDMKVTDANGLDRFKNGIFAEPFSDYALSAVSDPQYSFNIDSSKGIGRPFINREVIRIKFNSSSSTASQTGRAITLPYTEQSFMVQPFATKYRSSALVAFAWNGTLILVPSYDNHNDTINTGSINITIDNSKTWQDFAKGPFGQIWGDWRSTSTSNTVIVNGSPKVYNVDVGYVAGGTTEAQVRAQLWTYLKKQGFSPDDFTIGNESYKWTTSGNHPPGWTPA
jgi:hypothetical protein